MSGGRIDDPLGKGKAPLRSNQSDRPIPHDRQPPMRYRIRVDELRRLNLSTSPNVGLSTIANDDFIIKGAGGKEQLDRDINGGLVFHNHSEPGWSAPPGFDEEDWQHIIAAHSQKPFFVLYNALLYAYQAGVDAVIGQPTDRINNIYKDGDDIYLECYAEGYPVTDPIDGITKHIGYLPGPVRSVFKLMQTGDDTWSYELQYIETNNKDIADIVRGNAPSNSEFQERYCQPFIQYLLKKPDELTQGIDDGLSDIDQYAKASRVFNFLTNQYQGIQHLLNSVEDAVGNDKHKDWGYLSLFTACNDMLDDEGNIKPSVRALLNQGGKLDSLYNEHGAVSINSQLIGSYHCMISCSWASITLGNKTWPGENDPDFNKENSKNRLFSATQTALCNKDIKSGKIGIGALINAESIKKIQEHLTTIANDPNYPAKELQKVVRDMLYKNAVSRLEESINASDNERYKKSAIAILKETKAIMEKSPELILTMTNALLAATAVCRGAETKLNQDEIQDIFKILRGNYSPLFKKIRISNINNYIDKLFIDEQANKDIKKKLFEYELEHAYQIYIWQGSAVYLDEVSRRAEEIYLARYKSILPKSHDEYSRIDMFATDETHGTVKQIIEKERESNKTEGFIRRKWSDISSGLVRTAIDMAFDEAVEAAKSKVINREAIANDVSKEFVLHIKKMIENTPWKVGKIGGEKITINGRSVRVPSNVAKIYRLTQKAERNNSYKDCFNAIANIGSKASRSKSFTFFGLNARDQVTQAFYDRLDQAFKQKREGIIHTSDHDEQLETDIDNYGYSSNDIHLNDRELQELDRGIGEYKKDYRKKIAAYKKSNVVLGDENDSEINHKFFRQQFLRYIAKINADPEYNHYKGKEETRKNHPEKANIKMADFLGKKGEALYKLALEEEMHSRDYRRAILCESTTKSPGKKWNKRPVIIVAGPSGSGKSFAAKAAIEKANDYLPTTGEDTTNHYITIDGGKIREVSQMRKLAIIVANNKGYTGISDLHSKSSILEKIKPRLQEAVFKNNRVGVVIPETFSSFINPFSKIHGWLKRVTNLTNAKIIFARVDGMSDEKPSLFKKVVAFMGSRRAWKTTDFNVQPLSLNNREIPESKAYDGRGFSMGQRGSVAAEKWFAQHSRDHLSMVITNDLVLKKEKPANSHNWVDAEPNDDGVLLISKKIFNAWASAPLYNTDGSRLSLSDYKSRWPLLTPSIKSSSEINHAIALSNIRQLKNLSVDNSSVEYLTAMLQNIDIINLKDKSAVGAMIAQLKESIPNIRNHVHATDVDTITVHFNKLLESLTQLHHDLPEVRDVPVRVYR